MPEVKEVIAQAAKELREEIERTTRADREKLQENLERIVKDLEPRIESGEKAERGVGDLKEAVAKMSEDNARSIESINKSVTESFDKVSERLDEIEAKMKSRGQSDDEEFVNFGKGLAEAAKAAEISASTGGRRATFNFKSWMPRSSKAVTVASNAVYEPLYVPGIIGPAVRSLRIRNLLPTNRTTQNTIYFVKETAVVDGAAPQSALGAKKGETSFTINVESESVKTISHFVQVPTQVLDDLQGLEDYINSRMLYLLLQEEEDQLLYGNDQGQNLNGLMTQATAFDESLITALGVSNVTDIDRLRLAMAQVQVANYPPTGFVFHPYNWASIELLKDGDKRYIFAAPQDLAGPRMWGLPVVATSAMASGDFLVGAFQLGAAIWDRQQSNIQISTEDSDNFQKNLATIRAEERITLTVYRPDSFVEGDFANAIT